MDEIISYQMCAVKVRNAKLRNYLKSDIFRRFFICKNILKKLSCYHDNCFRYFMFGKYNVNGFVSKARVSACMYFLVVTL
jgi:hypothetical protein